MVNTDPLEIKISLTTVLRTFVEAEAPLLFQLTDANRAYLKRWLPWLDSCTQQVDSLAFIRGASKAQNENKALSFGIWDGGSLVGVISYNSIKWDERAANIGYWLSEKAQGRGIATQTTKALINYAFQIRGLKKLTISCAEENKRSTGVPERLKMKLSGRLERAENLYGQWVDHVIYEVNADSWLDED